MRHGHHHRHHGHGSAWVTLALLAMASQPRQPPQRHWAVSASDREIDAFLAHQRLANRVTVALMVVLALLWAVLR